MFYFYANIYVCSYSSVILCLWIAHRCECVIYPYYVSALWQTDNLFMVCPLCLLPSACWERFQPTMIPKPICWISNTKAMICNNLKQLISLNFGKKSPACEPYMSSQAHRTCIWNWHHFWKVVLQPFAICTYSKQRFWECRPLVRISRY